MQQERGQWGSSVGFVLAASGSAIGLGNIWRFPYVVGTHGGAAFVLLYLACVLLICLPYLFAELAVGRRTAKNPVGAILALKPRSAWPVVGGLGVLTGVFILSYYAVIAGWAFGYILKTLIAPDMPHAEFTASPAIVIPLFAWFIALTMLVVLGGIEHGIERWSKILMPVLLVLMLLVIARGLTLPGAGAGLEFYLKPDFSQVTGRTLLTALGQAFFSLSLGMGAMVTYGSYLPRTADLQMSGLWVAVSDTLVALLAGFMIFPAVFAMGKNPAAGPTLLFEVLPEIFAAMPFGIPVAIVFFVLLSIAALTSTVSLLEVVVAYFIDERRWSRRRAVIAVGIFTFLVGLPSALSQGASSTLSTISLHGNASFLGVMDFIWGNLSLAIGALLLSVFVGWVWGVAPAGAELREGSRVPPVTIAAWGLFIRYVCPVVIFVVLLNLFGLF
ncbi:MAG TPA: sodium-dependent transporter [Candidatus Polarisedimenticolaceae bacterium]|nr:sodium-dependent transporter [Candidatus Polarisedimenticolaceae bacterium]